MALRNKLSEILIKIHKLSPVQQEAITWSNTGLLSIGPKGTYDKWILFENEKPSFTQFGVNFLPEIH